MIDKGELPLDTFHVDHLGPLPTIKKSYKYVFAIVDAFTKFVWLYATKTTNTTEVVNRLKKQSFVFGNPRRIISDRGTAFTSKEFKDYCSAENINHVLTTTGVPRANGQVERVNRVLISLLTKLSDPKHEEWFKHLDSAQLYLNCAPHRSIGITPFRLLYGTHAHVREDPQILELLEENGLTISRTIGANYVYEQKRASPKFNAKIGKLRQRGEKRRENIMRTTSWQLSVHS